MLPRERETQPYLAKSKQYGTYLSHSRMKNKVVTDKKYNIDSFSKHVSILKHIAMHYKNILTLLTLNSTGVS